MRKTKILRLYEKWIQRLVFFCVRSLREDLPGVQKDDIGVGNRYERPSSVAGRSIESSCSEKAIGRRDDEFSAEDERQSGEAGLAEHGRQASAPEVRYHKVDHVLREWRQKRHEKLERSAELQSAVPDEKPQKLAVAKRQSSRQSDEQFLRGREVLRATVAGELTETAEPLDDETDEQLSTVRDLLQHLESSKDDTQRSGLIPEQFDRRGGLRQSRIARRGDQGTDKLLLLVPSTLTRLSFTSAIRNSSFKR